MEAPGIKIEQAVEMEAKKIVLDNGEIIYEIYSIQKLKDINENDVVVPQIVGRGPMNFLQDQIKFLQMQLDAVYKLEGINTIISNPNESFKNKLIALPKIGTAYANNIIKVFPDEKSLRTAITSGQPLLFTPSVNKVLLENFK